MSDSTAWFTPRITTVWMDKYLVHPTVKATISGFSEPIQSNPKPTVLVSLSRGNSLVDDDKIPVDIKHMLRNDDVLCSEFLVDTLIVRLDAGFSLKRHSISVRNDSKNWVPERVLRLNEGFDTNLIPDGPYFLVGRNLHQAWRLYPDTLDSFTTSIIPSKDDPKRFDPFSWTPAERIWRSIAVPSRLYSPRSDDRPLAGKRFSIKDNFKIAGVQTTQSNRAFVELYGPETETAHFVKRLIDLGAIIIGKTKMSAFASSEEATDQWIDFHAALNPRADGYQSPSGSTSGGSTALAGYDWLDYSIGTDTTGSIRRPAAWNGIFGLRTTWGSNNFTGVYAACRAFDTVGLLSRSIDGMQELLSSTIDNSKSGFKEYPRTLFYCTDFLPYAEPDHQAILEESVRMLENFLDMKRTEISIVERWTQCPPLEARGKNIREFLDKTAYYPFYWDGTHEFEVFQKEYLEEFGKPVYVGPYMRWKWDMGEQVTREQVSQAEGELEVYKRWFKETILDIDEQTASSAILIMPVGNSVPKYRDSPNSAPGPVPAFSPNYVATMQGLPQLVVPVGQMPFDSRISKRTEYLPAVLSIVGAKGSESMLVKLAKDALNKAGWPTVVQIGRLMFKLGKGPSYVAEENQDNGNL